MSAIYNSNGIGIGSLLVVVLSGVLAATFMKAGIGKALDLDQFSRDISAYELVPPSWEPTLAVVVVAMEAAIAGLFLLGLLPEALFVSAALLVTFSLIMGVNLNRGVKNPCGCALMMDKDDTISWKHATIDFVAGAAALVAGLFANAQAISTAFSSRLAILVAATIILELLDVMIAFYFRALPRKFRKSLRDEIRFDQCSHDWHEPHAQAAAQVDS